MKTIIEKNNGYAVVEYIQHGDFNKTPNPNISIYDWKQQLASQPSIPVHPDHTQWAKENLYQPVEDDQLELVGKFKDRPNDGSFSYEETEWCYAPKQPVEVKEDKLMLLAQRIESGMNTKGWNRDKFATEMNVQNSIITRWLSGKHNFTINTLFQIEDILNIKLIDMSEDNLIEKLPEDFKKALAEAYENNDYRESKASQLSQEDAKKESPLTEMFKKYRREVPYPEFESPAPRNDSSITYSQKWDGTKDCMDNINNSGCPTELYGTSGECFYVHTPKGYVLCRINDWVLKDAQGNFFVERNP
jgi:transcriptional regulator with XRE-family HTH domain